jgi:multisubunit Na+/H+ antiporter MnhB subunit
MDPASAFILGALCGVTTLLIVQAYGRRKVRKALAQAAPTAPADDSHLLVREMRSRVEVLERIVTEQPRELAREIDRLR